MRETPVVRISALALLGLVVTLAGCNAVRIALPPSAKARAQIVAEAQRKCAEESYSPAPQPIDRLSVENFDDCIVVEANKSLGKTREAVCALGRSGGDFSSSVEVYMYNGACRTDYE